MAGRLNIDVDRLRRREAGDRVLVYLDQSALSALATDERMASVRDALLAGVEGGRVLCPRSSEHVDETSLLGSPERWEAIDALGDLLSTGVEFKTHQEILWQEIHAAAGAFLGTREPRETWSEAFHEDPHTPRENLFVDFFGSSVRVRSRSEPTTWQTAEVRHEKSKENTALEQAYAHDRAAAGGSYERLAEAYLRQTIRGTLASIVDPDWLVSRYDALQAELAKTANLTEPDISPGSPFTRLQALAEGVSQTKWLVERFPELRPHATEFAMSAELRHMPTLAYPAVIRAGIAIQPNRRADDGDGYDIGHLTKGLSRCDIVTADGGMSQLCRDRHLVPRDCVLLGYRQLSQLPDAIASISDTRN
jgi:hypothetical protein